ncbi:MAG: hypothetical protein EOM44_11970 [Bacteroidia bacterium]|uniref:hypothetical protein n=1 Tax=Macellibacteroides fermentans TaxID=879969 RepID=UPI001DC5E54E|nr:hypothetical protein [Bacteroidia bacterium]
MRRLILIAGLMLFLSGITSDLTAQRNSNIGYYTIESECLGSELDGSITLRAWGTGRNRFDAVDQAKKNALREVIFKGIRKGSPECNQRPLLPEVNAEMKYEDFFNRFFSDRTDDYKKFCSGKDERLDNKIFRRGMGDSKMVTYSVIVRVLRAELKDYLAGGFSPQREPAEINLPSVGIVRQEKINWEYEIEPVSVGTQGTYLIKVWSYSRNPELAIEQAKRNAVHGVIFKGFGGISGVPGQHPLADSPNLEVEQAEFFRNFFANGGKYMKFVNITNDGSVAAEDRLKIGKEYKIGVVVSVNVAGLRRDLEEAGIIRSLGSGT